MRVYPISRAKASGMVDSRLSAFRLADWTSRGLICGSLRSSISQTPCSCRLKNMTAQITSLSELKKELQNNFAELKIDLFPSERRPEWIEVGKETWGETTIRMNLHSDCISIFGIVRGKADSSANRVLPAEAQDYLKQIRTLLEPFNLIVVHGPVTVGWSES